MTHNIILVQLRITFILDAFMGEFYSVVIKRSGNRIHGSPYYSGLRSIQWPSFVINNNSS